MTFVIIVIGIGLCMVYMGDLDIFYIIDMIGGIINGNAGQQIGGLIGR